MAASTLGKRERYEYEYFTNGGLGFADCFNDSQDTYLLNTDSDYQQMDSDVQYYYPDLEYTWGAEIQITIRMLGLRLGRGVMRLLGGVIMRVVLVSCPGVRMGFPRLINVGLRNVLSRECKL